MKVKITGRQMVVLTFILCASSGYAYAEQWSKNEGWPDNGQFNAAPPHLQNGAPGKIKAITENPENMQIGG